MRRTQPKMGREGTNKTTDRTLVRAKVGRTSPEEKIMMILTKADISPRRPQFIFLGYIIQKPIISSLFTFFEEVIETHKLRKRNLGDFEAFPSMATFSDYLDALNSTTIAFDGVITLSSGDTCLGPAVIDPIRASEIQYSHISIFLPTTLSDSSISIDAVINLKSPRNWPHIDKAFSAWAMRLVRDPTFETRAKQAGILDLISICTRVPAFDSTLFPLAVLIWSSHANIFAFPGAPMMITLRDITALTSLFPSNETISAILEYTHEAPTFESHTFSSYNAFMATHKRMGPVVEEEERIAFVHFFLYRYVLCPGSDKPVSSY
ncbi:hypothetical protein Dimus_038227 [Dionaea muscipula]